MKKSTKNMILIVGVLGIVLLVTYGFSYSKYVFNTIWNYYLTSKGFYFSSDDLDSSVVKNVDNLWDGGSVYFNIKNSLNELVTSDYDIKYRATCKVTGTASSYSTCHLNGTGTDTYEGTLSTYKACSNYKNDGVDVSSLGKSTCEEQGYEWRNQITDKNLYFDIVKTGTEELINVTVEVTVISTEPYKKQLKGEYILIKNKSEIGELSMDLRNDTNLQLVIANSYQENKCAKLSWDSNKLKIDIDINEVNSYSTDSNGYINEISFGIDKKSSLNYIFYKTDFSEDIGINAFTLVETNEC